MRLLEAILSEHSKKQTQKIVIWVGHSQARFDELFKLFLTGDSLVTQRAGWPLSNCVALHPELIRKHIGKLIKNVQREGLHNAVKRNTVRILQHVDIRPVTTARS